MFVTGFFTLGIIILSVIIIVLINVLLSMYRKVPPNRALIVTGLKKFRFKYS
ncbi:MAG: hypothetical protein ACP5RD_06785 [bacterium]|jgi:uncharacterized membrane protein YqiK